MQLGTSSEAEPPTVYHPLQRIVPWWNDLNPAVYRALHLPTIAEVASEHADVIVIGGGVAGLSAALALQKHGLYVLVLEKEAMLGLGATGQNAGIFTPGINMAMSELPEGHPARNFYPETTALFHQLIAEAKAPDGLLDAQQTGAFNLAESTRAAHKLEREVDTRLEAGLRAELWTPQQVAERTRGRLNIEKVICAMWSPDEGRIQPLTLLAHFAQKAGPNVTIVGQAFVTRYEEIRQTGKSACWQVTLQDGTVLTARALVSCVGPIVEANARIYALAFEADLPGDFPLFWDASPFTYADYRPGHGRLGVSGGRYGKAGVTKHDESYYQRLADSTRHWLPELANKQPCYKWAVDLYVTADLIPEMRVLEAAAPGVSIEGLGAHGVLPSMVLAGRAASYLVAHL